MLAGCYTLDLYCDTKSKAHAFDEFPHQYTDEFGTRCRAKARRHGRLINEKKDRTLCPKCNSASKYYVKNII